MLLWLLACTGASDVGSPEWDAFLGAREGHLRDLAEPIVACVAESDTDYPAFHGCWDWHSAVHGHYALYAVYRLTGDDAFLDAAEAQLGPEALAAELALMREGRLRAEVPYGMAWMLALAAEREAATGDADLDPLADEAAGLVRAWLLDLEPAQLANRALEPDYQNASWAAQNLWEHAVRRGDEELAAEAEGLVRDALLPLDCPIARDESEADEFFPPCLHRARAVIEVLPGEAPVFEPATLTPIVDAERAHLAGLNFSRAWGLWALFQETGDPSWREQWLDHVETHLAHPELWREDYMAYSHWVPQFGVYAIAHAE